MTQPSPQKRPLKLRVRLCSFAALGPGKADLLDAVDRCGSITAAAKDQGMSYRRAWLLIDELNRALKAPVLETSVSGAIVTQMGRDVLELYRRIEAKAALAVADELAQLGELIVDALPDAPMGCTGKKNPNPCR
jgi:molybdate transport system regulatory protein